MITEPSLCCQFGSWFESQEVIHSIFQHQTVIIIVSLPTFYLSTHLMKQQQQLESSTTIDEELEMEKLREHLLTKLCT